MQTKHIALLPVTVTKQLLLALRRTTSQLSIFTHTLMHTHARSCVHSNCYQMSPLIRFSAFFFSFCIFSRWTMYSVASFAWRNCRRRICVRIARSYAVTCAYRDGWTSSDASVRTVGLRCTWTNWWTVDGSKRLPFRWNRCSKFVPTSNRVVWRKARTINAPHTRRN